VALQATPFSPPPPEDAGADRATVRLLARQGAVVDCDGVFFASSAVEAASRRLAGLLAAHPEGVTVAQIRDELGTSRKHALPLLAHLDATGVTRRRGDLRIGGPRLPPAD
jgi:selenocysteine-specific elongation factor